MGQTVEINKVTAIGDILIVDTDRSLTGQDGHLITPDRPGEAVPGLLAERLFQLDLGIDHVYTLQNTISVRRRGGWDAGSISAVEEAVAGFLRFYPDGELP